MTDVAMEEQAAEMVAAEAWLEMEEIRHALHHQHISDKSLHHQV